MDTAERLIRSVLSQVGIEIGKHNSLIPFTREGNSIFDYIPDKPDMFILEIAPGQGGDVYANVESILNKSGLTIHSYGSFMFGNRIAVISLDIPVEEAGTFSMESFVRAITAKQQRTVGIRMEIDGAKADCNLYHTTEENAWACYRALRAIIKDDAISDADLEARGLKISTYTSR